MNINEIFGLRVKSLRLKKGLSQEKLAVMADIDRTYLPSIEKGKRNVSLTVASKLAQALELSISELLREECLNLVEQNKI